MTANSPPNPARTPAHPPLPAPGSTSPLNSGLPPSTRFPRGRGRGRGRGPRGRARPRGRGRGRSRVSPDDPMVSPDARSDPSASTWSDLYRNVDDPAINPSLLPPVPSFSSSPFESVSIPPSVLSPSTSAFPGALSSPSDITPSSSSSTATPAVSNRTTSTTLSEMTSHRFSDLFITPVLKRALADRFRYSTMTLVQQSSIPVALRGIDVLTKARTGTGKTLAFLIPALHRTLVNPVAGTSVLIISPTRELAQQIADEAAVLTTYVPNFVMQIVYGGTHIRKDVNSFAAHIPTLLVATPGRLVDHLRTPKSGFASALKDLSVLILDEADRLMDMGFSEDINTIFEYLPHKSERQTLLFSATLPNNVQKIVNRALRPSFELIDCVGDSEKNTHDHIVQSALVRPIGDQLAVLGCLLAKLMQQPDYKIVVFFPTARQTQLCAEAFQKMGRPVLEMHSRRTQSCRVKVSDAFRNGRRMVMFTSDVTARGMDYPEVTSVVQVGLPSDREQYIHRVGRTGRAGKGGNAVLLLTEDEARGFLESVKDLGVKQGLEVDEDMVSAMKSLSATAMRRVNERTRAMAYQAWLGFCNSNLKRLGWSKEELMRKGEEWAKEFCELDETPALPALVVSKMGLRNVEGVKIGSGVLTRPRGGRGGRGDGRRGRGGGRGGGGGGGGGGRFEQHKY